MANLNLPANLPENFEWDQIIPPNGEDIGKPEEYGYNYLTKQVNDTQKACNQLDQDLAEHNEAEDAHPAIQQRITELAGDGIAAHNQDENAHPAIRQKITELAGDGINAHNTDATAHVAIREKIGTDIATHNAAADTHQDIRTSLGNVYTKAETDSALASKANTGEVAAAQADINILKGTQYFRAFDVGGSQQGTGANLDLILCRSMGFIFYHFTFRSLATGENQTNTWEVPLSPHPNYFRPLVGLYHIVGFNPTVQLLVEPIDYTDAVNVRLYTGAGVSSIIQTTLLFPAASPWYNMDAAGGGWADA